MSQSQANRAVEVETLIDDSTAPERKGSGSVPKVQTQHEQDNPRRVQYGQAPVKEHPSQPGAEHHGAGHATKSAAKAGRSDAKRSG